MKSQTLIAALALLAAGPAAALQGPLFYECDITNRDERVDWISPKVGVIVTKTGQVLVTDSVTQNFFDKPVPAKIRSRGNKIIVDWSIKGVTDSSLQKVPNFEFRITINTTDNTARMSANPTEYPQKWTGRGTCVSRQK